MYCLGGFVDYGGLWGGYYCDYGVVDVVCY